MSPKEPLITTIIPTYQRTRLLERAIFSALAQEGVSKKICVYDNASGDNTRELVESLAKIHNEIEYFCHPRNIGGFANFQFGLRRVDTPYFSFLSDDDLLLPDFYNKALTGLANHPDAMMWAGTTVRTDYAGRILDARVESWPREGIYSGLEGLACMTKGRAPIWTGVVARAEVLETVGYLDEEVGSASDLDWILRIAARHKFFISKTPVAILTLHGDSYSENAHLSAFWPGWLKMIDNVLASPCLSENDRHFVQKALCTDAKRMLFRRSLRAIAKRQYGYAMDAATIQKEFFRDNITYRFLKALGWTCTTLPLAQRICRMLYNLAEEGMIQGRRNLRKRHDHLSKYVKQDKNRESGRGSSQRAHW